MEVIQDLQTQVTVEISQEVFIPDDLIKMYILIYWKYYNKILTTKINRMSILHNPMIKQKLDQLIVTDDQKNMAIKELSMIYKSSS